MKVLKLGNDIKYECPVCHSLLLIESSDWQSPKGSGFTKTITYCPVCNSVIYQNELLDKYNQSNKYKNDQPHIRQVIDKSESKTTDIDSAWDNDNDGWQHTL